MDPETSPTSRAHRPTHAVSRARLGWLKRTGRKPGPNEVLETTGMHRPLPAGPTSGCCPITSLRAPHGKVCSSSPVVGGGAAHRPTGPPAHPHCRDLSDQAGQFATTTTRRWDLLQQHQMAEPRTRFPLVTSLTYAARYTRTKRPAPPTSDVSK